MAGELMARDSSVVGLRSKECWNHDVGVGLWNVPVYFELLY